MAFDPSKDKILKAWKCEETGLIVSINQYDQGEPKLQIGPRILQRKEGGQRTPVKAGRLTVEDVDWLYSVIDEVRDEIAKHAKPE